VVRLIGSGIFIWPRTSRARPDPLAAPAHLDSHGPADDFCRLSYGELAALFPRAGVSTSISGGLLAALGFLYGWTLSGDSDGTIARGVGFARYLVFCSVDFRDGMDVHSHCAGSKFAISLSVQHSWAC